MAQFLRPSSDISLGGWSDNLGGTTNIYTVIDEVSASDTDFIKTGNNPTAQIYECGLSSGITPATNGHTVRYRYRKQGGKTANIIITLRQGTTVIKSQAHNGIGTSWTPNSFTLSGAEIANITDYTNLNVQIQGDASGGGATTTVQLSWLEFEIPDGLAQVNKSYIVRHDVSNFVNNSYGLRHDISQFVNKIYSLRHDIANPRVFVSWIEFELPQAILTQVNKSYFIRHDITSFVNKSYSLRHDVSQFVNKLYVIRDDILNFANKSYILRNDISQLANKSYSLRHDLAGIVSKIYTISNRLSNFVNKVYGISNKISQLVGKSYLIRDDISQFVNNSKILRNDISSFVNKLYVIRNDILNSVSNSYILRQDISNFINKIYTLRHSIVGVVGNSYILRHDLSGLVNKLYTLRSDILNFVNKSYFVRWDISQLVSNSKTISNKISQFVSNSKVLRYDVSELVNKSYTISNKISEFVSNTYGLRHDVANWIQVAKSYILRHDVITIVAPSEPSGGGFRGIIRNGYSIWITIPCNAIVTHPSKLKAKSKVVIDNKVGVWSKIQSRIPLPVTGKIGLSKMLNAESRIGFNDSLKVTGSFVIDGVVKIRNKEGMRIKQERLRKLLLLTNLLDD